MKKQSGITLLALVITIVVMLILAAVTINTIVSDDGLVRKSQEAKFKMEATTYKERTQPTKVPQGQETTDYNHIWAIREILRGQIRTLAQGSTNAEDAKNFIQVADETLNKIYNESDIGLLENMRYIAISMTDKSNTEEDIKALEAQMEQLKKELRETDRSLLSRMYEIVAVEMTYKTDAEEINAFKYEMDQLKTEIDRAAETTQFNSINILKGESFDIQLGGEASKQGSITFAIDSVKWKELYGADEIDYKNLTELTEKIKNAMAKVLKQKQKLGALLNRLEHTISYIDNVCENVTSLESSIFDTNMAEAMERYQNNDLNAEEELSTGYNSEDNAIKMATSWETTLRFVQIAEGALNEPHSMLQRMYEISVQADNDILEDKDREVIQLEIDELIKELDRQFSCCIVANRNLLQGDLQYVEKIDTNKLGISNLSVSTRKDARKAKKLISDAIEYISKVKGNLGNRMNSLEEIKDQKADPGYAFDIVNDGKKSEQTEKMDIDGVINSKFAIENGILYYTGTNELEKKWAQELNIQIKQ